MIIETSITNPKKTARSAILSLHFRSWTKKRLLSQLLNRTHMLIRRAHPLNAGRDGGTAPGICIPPSNAPAFSRMIASHRAISSRRCRR